MSWMLLSVASAICLGVYDIAKKVSVRDNAVPIVLWISVSVGCLLWSFALGIQTLLGDAAAAHWFPTWMLVESISWKDASGAVCEIHVGGLLVDAGILRAQASSAFHRGPGSVHQPAVDIALGSHVPRRATDNQARDWHRHCLGGLLAAVRARSEGGNSLSQQPMDRADDCSDRSGGFQRHLRQDLAAVASDITGNGSGLVFSLSVARHDAFGIALVATEKEA